MGQSFLTHDEKSSTGSASPDLLQQFNGVGAAAKYFGSLSSVKEGTTTRTASVDSSSRSPLLEDSSEEGNHFTTPRSSMSPRSTTGEGGDDDVYSSLVPTPILPGNVDRLKKIFMEGGFVKKRFPSGGPIDNIESGDGRGGGRDSFYSDLDCRYFSKDAVSSRSGTPSASSSHRLNRHSLHAFSPCSGSGGVVIQHIRKSRTLPPPTPTSYEEKLVGGIRSDNDLSECFRKMGFGRNNLGSYSAGETPLVRRRQRMSTRPNVPPPIPRSVIIRAGYLPSIQKVGRMPTSGIRGRISYRNRKGLTLASSEEEEEEYEMEDVAPLLSRTSVPTIPHKKEDLELVSSSSPLRMKSKGLSEVERRSTKRNVAKQEAHTNISSGSGTGEKKVLMKDAEVNTSAEVLVLPKGTKTSVLLKSGVIDEVDGIKSLKKRRRKRKRIHRRVGRVFGRVMIRFLEFF